MNSQIQFWASGNNYQKRNSNSGKCKRGHVLLFTSHQIFREKFPIQGDGSTFFFGKCTHSYETKAVLLQEHILQSWYHTRKAECLLNLDRNSFRKKNHQSISIWFWKTTKNRPCAFSASFCVSVNRVLFTMGSATPKTEYFQYSPIPKSLWFDWSWSVMKSLEQTEVRC